MSELFLTVLNMSLTASYVILFVIFVRLPLKKAPKFISYAIWGVVAFRLIIPISFESMFSLMPRNTSAVPIPHDIIYQQSPQINSGIKAVDSFISETLPAPAIGASVSPLQIYTAIGAYIWVLGITALLVYSLASILILKRQLKNVQLIENNIFEAKNLRTPFVLGSIKPKIYLPVGLNVEERDYILLHEQIHICRKDHIIKILAFLILSIHWFNPLVWIAFMLMSMDMELSCDERVLKKMDEDMKKPYAASLLSLAAGRHILSGSPLAFGEGNVRGRIINVLNYKRPRFWAIIFSIVILISVGVGLIANPKAKGTDEFVQITDSALELNNERNEHITYLKPIAAEWSYDQNLGPDIPFLDYASDDIVIFHSYFGLFVYELDSRQFIRSLDLAPIDCQATQGDNFCTVSVSADGNTVQLHPAASESMYVYIISDNTLTEAPYKPMSDRFDGLVSIADVMDPNKIGNCSFSTVKFNNDEFGYLQASEWIVGSLTYVRGDMVYKFVNYESNPEVKLPSGNSNEKAGASVGEETGALKALKEFYGQNEPIVIYEQIPFDNDSMLVLADRMMDGEHYPNLYLISFDGIVSAFTRHSYCWTLNFTEINGDKVFFGLAGNEVNQADINSMSVNKVEAIFGNKVETVEPRKSAYAYINLDEKDAGTVNNANGYILITKNQVMPEDVIGIFAGGQKVSLSKVSIDRNLSYMPVYLDNIDRSIYNSFAFTYSPMMSPAYWRQIDSEGEIGLKHKTDENGNINAIFLRPSQAVFKTIHSSELPSDMKAFYLSNSSPWTTAFAAGENVEVVYSTETELYDSRVFKLTSQSINRKIVSNELQSLPITGENRIILPKESGDYLFLLRTVKNFELHSYIGVISIR
jgi:beta-lactamase regulating signal transducer with metallopeptidase domain